MTYTQATSTTALVLAEVDGRILAAGDSPGVIVISSAPTADFGTDVHFTVQEPHLIVVFGASGAVSNSIFTELEGIPRS